MATKVYSSRWQDRMQVVVTFSMDEWHALAPHLPGRRGAMSAHIRRALFAYHNIEQPGGRDDDADFSAADRN